MAGLDEEFKLKFDFGGNDAFLKRLVSMFERLDGAADGAGDGVEDAAKGLKEFNRQASRTGEAVNRQIGLFGRLGKAVMGAAQAYFTLSGGQSMLLKGKQAFWDFGMGSMDYAAVQERAETQLGLVLRNQGNEGALSDIKAKASDVQGRTVYGDEAMIRGAAELATYVSNPETLKRFMDLLPDYAAGMTGGGAVTPEQMEQFATGLGMAFDGNYMALRRKGFDVTELQELKKLEDAGGTVTEDMKVDALERALSTWKGLAEEMNGLDQSAPVRFSNTIGDLREELGQRLWPVYSNLVRSMESHLPEIRKLMDASGRGFEAIAGAADKLIGPAAKVADALTAVLDVVGRFPGATALAVAGFAGVSKGASLSVPGLMGLKDAVDGTSLGLGNLANKGALLAGGAGLAMGLAGGAETTSGVLQTMGMAAAAGASQFGLLGAAVGSAAASIGTLIGALYQLYGAKAAEDERNRKYESQSKEIDRLSALKKATLSGDPVAMQRYEAALASYEANFGELDAQSHWHNLGAVKKYSDAGLTGTRKYAAAQEEAAGAARKESKTQVTYNTNCGNVRNEVRQDVKVTASVDNLRAVLDSSLRRLIESQFRMNRTAAMVTEV